MDILIRMLMAVLKDRKHKKQRRVLSTVLAAVVVFMTTYSLILPAITLEESTAETTDGIFLESADVSEADPADDDVDPSGELLLTDDAREESAPASDGWEDGLIEDADWEENGELADIPDEPALTDTGDEATPDGILEEATDAAEAEEDTQALSFTDGELTVRETLVSRQGGEDFLRLTYGAEARIPEDTVCSAQAFIPASSGAAMDEGSSLAEKYEQAAREKAARDYPEWDKIEVRMFDLHLAANGQTVQAENALHAELTLAQPIRSEALLLLHFEDNEAQEELRRIHAGETAGASSVEVHLPEVMHDAEFIRNANGEVYKIRFASQTLNTFAVVIRGESEETENRKEETAHETEPLTEAGTEAGTEAAVETLTESTAAGDETEEAAETETGNVYAETEEATEAVTETASEATEEATEDTTESEESVGEGETESELEEQYPEVEFSDSTQYTQVKVYAPEGAFPEGTQMLLSDVEDDETIAAICDAALAENSLVQKVHAVDISFRNSRNEEIEPLLPIRVEMTAEKCAEVGSSSVSSSVVHVDDSGNATIVENAQKVEAEAEDEKDADKLEDVETIAFEAKEFSVYALVYTVDFEYEVDGKIYQFSLPGGGFVSFTDLVEVLGIIGDTNSEENGDEIDATEAQAANGLLDVKAGNAAKKFVADVASVEFSSPELVDVSKVEADTTVGQIKENRGLEVEYSTDLTEEQIEEINAQTVKAGDWALISVQPFTSEEQLTVTMKDSEVFTIRVTDAQIKKTVIDAKGDTWEITVTYGDNAQIPDGAELKVREILPEDEEYEQYYQQSLEKVGVVNAETEEAEEIDETLDDTEEQYDAITDSNDNYAHIFDIQIWFEDYEIQPASDVSVSIKLLDAPEGENTDLQVVHFGKDGLEVMELAQNDEQNDKQTGVTELSFVTDEFSVYTVVDVNNANLANTLSNGPYALVTGISGDPGATTGYSETYDGNQVQDYFTIIVNAQAMKDTDGVQVYKYIGDGSEADNSSWVPNVTGLAAEGVHAWTDSTGSYVGGSPTQWFFEQQSGNNYKIYTFENGRKNYVFQSNEDKGHKSVGLTTNEGDATAFTVDTNSDGTVLIHSGNWYLYNNTDPAGGWNEWVLRNYLLKDCNGATPSGDEYKFRLCKESDDFDSFAAQKVSAYSITTNANYVIYRKFEDTQGNETLYALAHDGTFVRVYDGGDTIYWRETDKNIYWNYQMDGNYPVLFTQDPVTHEPIFINPNHSTGQTLSTTAVGLTLIGKDSGEYSTAIECWDQTAYDYAGLHVTVDNSGTASLSTGTRVAGTSDEFLFAVASQMPGATAEIVDTVDSDSLGIKITMFDYGNANGNYAAGDKLSEMTAVAGSAEYTPHAAHALVKAYLESGLPSSTTNGAMTGLFTADGTAVTAYMENVNHLFLQSYYDENGTFRYRSEDNYAYLPFDAGTGTITGTDFTVYRQAATPYTSITSEFLNIGHTYYYHGHFMPYNDIDMNNNLSRLMNQYGNAYDPITGEIIGEIPLEDGRTYEDIYGVKGTPNFYTGMRMEANFTQPRDGKLDNGDEMIFKFTGDDDMWVYIDDVLVLDIGGIHEPLSGTINFATGVVTNPTGSSLAGTTTLYQIFQNVLTASDTPQSVKDKINAITWKDIDGDGTPDTFADYTNHSFSAFYMERGAGASNLDLQFNLKVVLTNQFTVQKEIPEDVDDRFDNQVYKFQATYMDGTEKPLHAGIENVCTAVVYKDKKDDQGNPVPVSVDDDGYFTLRAGEAAVFMMADESIRYNVKEVDLDQYNLEKITINGDEVTEHVEINDQQAVITDNAAVAGYDEVGDRSNVLYTNYPKTQNLLITKHISDDSAPLVEGENPVFEFRVYLESTVSNVDGTTQQKLVPYSYGPYYLTKEVEGVTHYFTLTGVNNAPVDQGTEPVVCSTTGRSGSINSIPPEYTIVIPKLVVGTDFYLEERRDNIPEGYEFVKEELKEGTYDPSSLIADGATSEVINRVIARDENDHQEFDPDTVGQIKDGKDAESHVYNRKPAVIITVEKEWDPAPEDGTSVTVELHRYAKITKGTISVTLYDNNEAPIEGAEFELYKDGEATGTKVTTNVNGIASVSGLEAGTYKLVQLSTPAGYSMDGHTTETKTLTVVDNVTTPQTLSESLINTALVTAGRVTLTITDSGVGSGTAGAPISGATFALYKNGAIYNTGYTSNDEGKVVVGNLAAGEYYFVQTGTTSDYKLPNVTRTENFTVVENPGVTQEFSQSMTNSLKGKGTVSLTLLKDSGAAISGASFQLKSGSTVLETATTGSDGTLSFSTELYEGTYTVRQVDTGSAGDDYATAADQNVTIEANSVTTQQKQLTFENTEASGKVTVYLYRVQGTIEGTGSNNSGTLYDTWSGLKAGSSIQVKISRKQNGHGMYYCTDYNSSNRYGTWTKITQWSGNDYYLTFNIPNTPAEAEYHIGVSSGWGQEDGSVSFVNKPSSSRAFRSNRVLAAPMLKATVNRQTATHTNALPASAPEGYAEDSTFEAIEITLPTNGSWQYTFDAQDKFDANGDPYYYYIVETACSDDDYWIDSYTGDLLNDVGTITVKNVKEKTGSIQVKKSFSGVDALPAGFQITNNYNSEIFTVANASGSGTTEDPYVWTLSGIPSGTTVSFTESGATVNGYNLTVTSSGTVTADSTVAAIAVAGSTVTADLVNTYELKTTEITLKKVDKDDLNETNATLLKGAAFTLSKYESDSYQSKDLSWGTNGSKNLSDDKKPDGTYTLNGVFTFEGLTAGYYKIEETSFPAGYVKLSSDPTFKVEANASNELIITILNNPDNLLKLVDGEMTIVVGNTPGVALPNTGGPGTRLFTILGSILILGAGVLLWRRRRLI